LNFVNKEQDSTERRVKYAVVRQLGYDVQTAQRMRDFTWRNMARRTFAVSKPSKAKAL